MVVSSDRLNRSRIASGIVAAVTSDTHLADAPGNLALPMAESGLPKPSVVNVSQLLSVDRRLLQERVGWLPSTALQKPDAGFRLVLAL